MKTIEDRANEYAWKMYPNSMFLQEWEECRRHYTGGATEQREIDRKSLVEIYDLYSALIDDLYCGYRLSDYNGGVVDGFEETMSMGEALDKLNALFNKALFSKSTEE